MWPKPLRQAKWFKFTKSACHVLDRNQKIVAKATKVGNLYQFDHTPNHERVNFARNKKRCVAQMFRLSVWDKFTPSNRRADELLELVHSDVCGKMNEKSLFGAEYFLTFIDYETKYVWVYCPQLKTRLLRNFVNGK